MNYLKGANLHRAVLVNFGTTSLQYPSSCDACRRTPILFTPNRRFESADFEILEFPVPRNCSPQSLRSTGAAAKRPVERRVGTGGMRAS